MRASIVIRILRSVKNISLAKSLLFPFKNKISFDKEKYLLQNIYTYMTKRSSQKQVNKMILNYFEPTKSTKL